MAAITDFLNLFKSKSSRLDMGMQDELPEDYFTKNYSTNKIPEKKDGEPSENVARKAVLSDPLFDFHMNNTNYLAKNKITSISNRTLREITIKDWLISTIISMRCSTAVRFSRLQDQRFDMGFRILKKNIQDKPLTQEDVEVIKSLENFILNCGRTKDTPIHDKLSFTDFMSLIIRDILTYGNIAVEKVLTKNGGLHRFRPVPAESVYHINPINNRQKLETEDKRAASFYQKPKSDNDFFHEGELNIPDVDNYKYVQLSYDGKVLGLFGDENMVFKLFSPQNSLDSNGYAISMVEQSILLITNHMNTETFNSNFFTNGKSAQGILHIKGNIDQNDLSNFRHQFHHTINSASNAWRTPIVAGADEINWVPFNGSSREMEYINYNSHIMRCICSQFQIDPIEIGLDYLTSANGRGGVQKESGQFKITYSREKGLIPLLLFVEDFINKDILPALDKKLAKDFTFKFLGYSDETPQQSVALQQAQMTTFASMNDLLRNEERQILLGKDEKPLAIAEIPLNQAFWAIVEKNYTRGEIREYFFGDKGASKRKELQYIPGDPQFLAWQEMLMSIKGQQNIQQQQQEQLQQQVQGQPEEEQDNPEETTEQDIKAVEKESGLTSHHPFHQKNPLNITY